MLGNYEVLNNKLVYVGNKQHAGFSDINTKKYIFPRIESFLKNLGNDPHYSHLQNIDNAVFVATVEYFKSINASWCNLPIITKMISSPGEVYAGKKLDYTTDALPVTLKWFDTEDVFLAESSQFYLELRLLLDQIKQVYSIYNSFRKEPMDFSHLSEFQHIEYEGKVSFSKNIDIFLGLIRFITQYIIEKNRRDLEYYLTSDEITKLNNSFNSNNIETLTFEEAMKVLNRYFDDSKYLNFSLKNFGSLEEVALTRVLGKHCIVTNFPLEEIPFYHDKSFTDKNGKSYACNADFILLGYREVIGSGQRITDYNAIREKAKFFNLPMEDYEIYVNMRKSPNYETTCGFGLGWQRYTQWLLKMPFIWQMSHIPRGDHSPRP